MSDALPSLTPRASVVVPAYEEGEAIVPSLLRIREAASLADEILVVIDSPDDSTAPVVERLAAHDPIFRAVVNTYGRGPANAIRFGIDQVASPIAVVTMADGSDDPQQIDDLVRLVERGVVVAAASRYMPGGQQVDAPRAKAFLSRLAGRLLASFARVGTRDATNSFKAYSVPFVRDVGIDSRHGFEIGIELVAKARRLRRPVAEVPTIWLERQVGESNFRVGEWAPKYFVWFRFAFGRRLSAEQLRRAARERVEG
jgi:dolichol-phosphate mannosyltransferase